MGLLRALVGIACYWLAAFFVCSVVLEISSEGYSGGENIFGAIGLSIGAYFFYRIGKSCFYQPEKAIPTNTVKLTPDQIQSVFYRLIKTNQGKITVMRLAMETGLSGKEAQAYLDEQVKHFNADYEVNDKGDMVYRFPL